MVFSRFSLFGLIEQSFCLQTMATVLGFNIFEYCKKKTIHYDFLTSQERIHSFLLRYTCLFFLTKCI